MVGKGKGCISVSLIAFGLLFFSIGYLIRYGGELLGGQTEQAYGYVTGYDSHSSDGTRMYSPRGTYVAPSGETIAFSSSSSTSWRPYEIGEKVVIQFDPNDFEDASIRGNGSIFMWVFGGIGILVMAIGTAIGIKQVKNKRAQVELKRNGRRIKAQVTDIFLDQSMMVNGRYPYRIEAQWLREGSEEKDRRVFRSEPIWYNPELSVQRGDDIPVLISKSKSKRYLVDLSALPEGKG